MSVLSCSWTQATWMPRLGSIGSSLEQRSFKDLLVEMLMAKEVMVAEEEEVVVVMVIVRVEVAEEEEVMVMVMSSSEMVFELFDGGPQYMR